MSQSPLLEKPEGNVGKSRRNDANILSRIFFGWVFDTIKVHYPPYSQLASQVTLETEHIADLRPNETSQALYEKFKRIFEKRKESKHGLIESLFITSRNACIFVFTLQFILILGQMCNPLLIKAVIEYLEEPEKDVGRGIGLIAAILSIRCLSVVCTAHCFSSIRYVGYDWMSIISMALLGKSMKVSFLSNNEHSSGQVLNYMQVDANKLQWLGWYLQQVLLMPLQFAISIYMMFSFIGVSFLGGLGVVFLMILFNIYIGKILNKYQSTLMKDKDARTKCANEIFQQIKFIKVNAFEQYFRNKLTRLRNQEVKTIKTRFFLSCLNILSIWLSPMLILNATFIIFIAIGNDLTPSNTFATISLFQMLQQPLFFLPMALNALVEANISLKRVQNFLTTKEMMSECITNYNEDHAKYALEVINGNFYWANKKEEEKKDPKSKDGKDEKKQKQEDSSEKSRGSKTSASLSTVKKSRSDSIRQSLVQVSDIVGPPEKLVLKDLFLKIPKGQFVSVIGDVGSGKSSLLQAILGEMLYKNLVPQVSVNGSIAYVSQKAWIQNATVKDNIIFGKEFDQQKYDEAIYHACLKEDLKILVKGDQTMIGEKGVNLSGGQKARVTLARAIYSDSDIILLDDPISAVDVHVGKFIMHETLNGYLKQKTRVLVTHALNYCQFTDYIFFMEDGKIVEQGQFDMISQSDRFNQVFKKFYNEQQQSKEQEQEVAPKKQELVLEKRRSSHAAAEAQKDEVDELMLMEDRNKGSIQVGTMLEYYRYNGGWPFALFLFIQMVLWTSCYIGSNLWMAHWTSASQEAVENNEEFNNYFYLGIYSSLSISYGLLAFIRSWVFVLKNADSANALHNKMASCLIYAPLCQFFERVPLGRILNRLTKDQNVLDSEIMWSINWMLVQVFLLMANTFLNVFTSSYYVLIPIVIFFTGAFYLQRIYMAASRELYRLEAISKSPILSFFTETIMGITTIRAFEKHEQFLRKHGHNQDINRKIFLEQISTNVWFSLVLGLSSFIVNITAIIFCMFYSTKNPAFAGLLMTYASTLDYNISSTVQCISSVENSMISFERCVAYTNVKPENGYQKTVQMNQQNEEYQEPYLQNWPKEGQIAFQNYSVRYRDGLPPALKNVNLEISPREKVGVVGRTGAGKSTVTLTILRILEAFEGRILIDGVDIASLPLKQLRESITMILQDATLFDGTIRENIDPLNCRTDQEIEEAIEKCCLKEMIQSRKGLDTHINEAGDNLSAGEKQLVCIARAVLKKSPIVLIDEATANIDIETEHKLQETIQRAFAECTVITIAHRINTIMHCDKIIVLDKGEVKEFGYTKELLKQPDSLFYGIYQEALKEQKQS